MLHSDLVEKAARTARGDLFTIHTSPGRGVVTGLMAGLPDYGIEAVEIDALRVESMGDAAFVDFLNDTRLSDKILILTGAGQLAPKETARVRENVAQCFSKFGGRGVLVEYGH